MTQSQPPIGIDLGTTYSVVATLDNEGQVQVLRNSVGGYLTPSVVYFESENNLVVGQAAKDARVYAPKQVSEFIKRQMGSDFKFSAFNRQFSPIEISAVILKKLKEDAQVALNGTTISDVVVTCPAYFTAEQRDATEKAAIMAGLNLLALINEPTAAAVAFGMGGDKTGYALVFDLGGGTFDVTVLKFAPGNVIDVLVSDGDHELGGKDFDDAIMRLAVDHFLKETGYNMAGDIEAYAELRDKAEKAKRELSQVEKTNINLSAGGYRGRFELTREQLNEAIAGQIEYMRGTVEDALAEAKLTPDDIQDVLLVGGSTYMPVVRQMVEEFFGRTPNTSVNPDEAVARGAGLYAAKLMTEGIDKPEIRDKKHLVSAAVQDRAKLLPSVQDIVNHSIGITAVRSANDQVGYNSIILKRGMKLPAESEDTFHTLVNDQSAIESSVNEGEDENLDDINKLASFVFEFEKPKPIDYPVNVHIALDRSGILRVTITDPKTKRNKLVELKYGQNMSQADVQEGKKWLNSVKTGG